MLCVRIETEHNSCFSLMTSKKVREVKGSKDCRKSPRLLDTYLGAVTADFEHFQCYSCKVCHACILNSFSPALLTPPTLWFCRRELTLEQKSCLVQDQSSRKLSMVTRSAIIIMRFSLDMTVAFLRKALLPCWLAREGPRAFCQPHTTEARIEALLPGPVLPSARSGFSLVS